MPQDILFEDNHLIAVYKYPGELAQDDASGEGTLQEKLTSYIKQRDQKPGNVYLGTLHRLDKPVSGTVLFAKTSKAAARMSEIIRDRKALKIYLALTRGGSFGRNGQPEVLADALERRGDVTLVIKGGSIDARLEIITIGSHNGFSLHAVRLITGKKHQIRAQLASRGFPIAGDAKYGSKDRMPQGAIALHCLCMGFIHPVKKEKLLVTAQVPEYIAERFGAAIDTDKAIRVFDATLE